MQHLLSDTKCSSFQVEKQHVLLVCALCTQLGKSLRQILMKFAEEMREVVPACFLFGVQRGDRAVNRIVVYSE